MRLIPILFSTAMVQAILEGRKTQTRRTGGFGFINQSPNKFSFAGFEEKEGILFAKFIAELLPMPVYAICPYGRPGDILWVREEHYRYGHWIEKEGVFTPTGRQKWMFVPLTEEVLYTAPETFRKGMHNKDPHTPAWHKRLARFMPRSACRLYLRNTGVRVERLQDISEKDAKSEGVIIDHYGGFGRSGEEWRNYMNSTVPCRRAKESFRTLWQSINGAGSWEANSWVWPVNFEVTEKPA